MVLNHGRSAGAMDVITSGDSVVVRYEHHDRGGDRRLRTTYHVAADGTVLRSEMRGTFGGSDTLSERFDRSGGVA